VKVRLARALFGWWKRLLTVEQQFDMVHGFTVHETPRPLNLPWGGAPKYVYKEKRK